MLALHGEINPIGHEPVDHIVVLFRFARTRRVHETSSARDDVRGTKKQFELSAPHVMKIRWHAPPADVGIAPNRAEPRTRSVEEHPIELWLERQRVARVRLDDAHGTSTRRCDRPRQEIDDESGVGEVYISSLVRSQLRSALGVVALLVGCVSSLPLVFVLVEPVAQARVAGVPVPWIVLGGLVYPFLLVLGWRYVRRAERAEADFADLVEPRPDDAGRVP